jgi:hypothetical protein
MGAKNRVGIGMSYRPAIPHRLTGRYENLVPTRFIAPIDCSKIPTLIRVSSTNCAYGAVGILEKLSSIYSASLCHCITADQNPLTVHLFHDNAMDQRRNS